MNFSSQREFQLLQSRRGLEISKGERDFFPDCDSYFGIEYQDKRKSLPYPELEVPSCRNNLQGQVVRNYKESLTNQSWQSAVKKIPLYQQHVKGGYMTGKG